MLGIYYAHGGCTSAVVITEPDNIAWWTSLLSPDGSPEELQFELLGWATLDQAPGLVLEICEQEG